MFIFLSTIESKSGRLEKSNKNYGNWFIVPKCRRYYSNVCSFTVSVRKCQIMTNHLNDTSRFYQCIKKKPGSSNVPEGAKIFRFNAIVKFIFLPNYLLDFIDHNLEGNLEVFIWLCICKNQFVRSLVNKSDRPNIPVNLCFNIFSSGDSEVFLHNCELKLLIKIFSKSSMLADSVELFCQFGSSIVSPKR